MAAAAEPDYVRCAACGDSATTPLAFLLDCCACDKSYHHTCATPPLSDDALLARAAATREKRAAGTIHDWRCHNCLARQQLAQLERERGDDVIVISSDESERTPTPPPPPPPVWKKSVLDLSPPKRPRPSNQGASSSRLTLDHVSATAAQRAQAANSRLAPVPAPKPGPSRPKPATSSVPIPPTNARNSVNASTSSQTLKAPLSPPPSRTPSQTLPDVDFSKLRKRSRSASGGKDRPSKRVKREGQQPSDSSVERIQHAQTNNMPPREPSPGPRKLSPMAVDDDRDLEPPAGREPSPAADVFGMPPEMMTFLGDEADPPPSESEEDDEPGVKDEPSTQAARAAVQREPTPQPNGKRAAVPAGVDVVDLTLDSDDDAPPPPPAKPSKPSLARRPHLANPTPPASRSAPPPDASEPPANSAGALPARPPQAAKVVPAKRRLSPEPANGPEQTRADARKRPPYRWKDNAAQKEAGPSSARPSMQPPPVPRPPPLSQPPRAPPGPMHAYERLMSLPPIACLQSDHEHSGSSTPAAASQPAPASERDELEDEDADEDAAFFRRKPLLTPKKPPRPKKTAEVEQEESPDARAERGRLQEHIREFQRRRGMDAAKALPPPAPPPPASAPPPSAPALPPPRERPEHAASTSQRVHASTQRAHANPPPRLHGERRASAAHTPRTPTPPPALSKAALWGAAATSNNPSPQSPSKDVLWAAAATSNHAAATASSSYTAAASDHSKRAPAPPVLKKPKPAPVAAPAPAPPPPPARFAVPRLKAPAPALPEDTHDDAQAAHELMYARFILNHYDGAGPPPHDARLWRAARKKIATRGDALRVVDAWERAQAGPSAPRPSAPGPSAPGPSEQLEQEQEEEEEQPAQEEEEEALADESVVETSVLEEREMPTPRPRPRPPISATTSLRRQLATLDLGSASSSGEVSDAMQVDGAPVMRVGGVVYTKARQRQTARKTVARRSVASSDAGSAARADAGPAARADMGPAARAEAGPSGLIKSSSSKSTDVEMAEAAPSDGSSTKSSARATPSGQSRSLQMITASTAAREKALQRAGTALQLHPLARTTGPEHLDDVIARLTARRVANPAPPVGATPVKGRGRARQAALERRLLDGEVLSDAHADTRRARREVVLAVKQSGSRACESFGLVVQRAPRDALDRAL